MRLAGLQCSQELPPPGDERSRFSGGKGYGGAYRPGDGTLVLLAAISLTRKIVFPLLKPFQEAGEAIPKASRIPSLFSG